jgi:23S rRNA pseudouridine1911/1915/1917 synthase
MSDEISVDAFDGEVLDLRVPHSLDEMRVDRALAMLTGLSRSETHQLVENGAVSIDGRVVLKSSQTLEADQHLVAVLPAPDDGHVSADPNVQINVVGDDEHFVVVNKDPGQVVHPGAGQRDGTLIAGLLALYPEIEQLSHDGTCDPKRPGVVHRLDKGTSGLLVVAKTREGFGSLSAQLAERTMERTYLGLVEGHVVEERGIVDAPIGRSTKQPTLVVVRGDGRPARTGYRVLERIESPHAVTLLELKLETGRTHQIRVHLATIGHPVVNDTRYGHRRDRRLDAERFFLHSTTLSFLHPISSERVSYFAALPSDLSALVTNYVEN